MKPSYEELEQKLIESERYGRQTDITIENLERRVEQLAAENAGLKQAMAVTLEHVSVMDTGQAGVAAMIVNDALHHSETPATDAILAEVRASAITDALKSLDGVFDTDCVMESNGISYEDAEQRTAGAYAVSKSLEDFAAQLRKGVQS